MAEKHRDSVAPPFLGKSVVAQGGNRRPAFPPMGQARALRPLAQGKRCDRPGPLDSDRPGWPRFHPNARAASRELKAARDCKWQNKTRPAPRVIVVPPPD